MIYHNNTFKEFSEFVNEFNQICEENGINCIAGNRNSKTVCEIRPFDVNRQIVVNLAAIQEAIPGLLKKHGMKKVGQHLYEMDKKPKRSKPKPTEESQP